MTTVADLTATIERLWPDASEVVLSEVGDPLPLPVGDVEHYRAVPSLRSPRLVVPVERAAASNAMRRFSSSVSAREVVERLGIATIVRFAGTGRFGSVVVVDPGAGITAHLSDVLGQDVVVSLGIGSERANRKPVLQVFGRSGRPIAHVKVGDTDVAAGHVRGEADALRSIAGHRWDRVRVPELVHHGTWRGMEILAMSSLSASPWQVGRRRRFPSGAMAEVAATAEEGAVELAATPAWTRWSATAATLVDPMMSERLRAAMRAVEDRHGSAIVRCGAWHGDFAPWNMAWSDRRLSLWDWERYETGVPVGLDAVHYAVNVRIRAAGFVVPAVRSGLADAEGLLGAGAPVAALCESYLVGIAARYLAAAEGAGGDVILGSGVAALDVLDLMVGTSGRTPT